MTADEPIDRTFAALADPHRRQTIEVLGRGPLRAGELARAVGLEAPAMSRCLRALRLGGLIEESPPDLRAADFDARVRVYRLRSEPMIELLRWAEETERLWSEQLAAFKAHLETPPDAAADPAGSA